MSTTVIDALLVTLGLDATDFKKGADATLKTQKKLADQSTASVKQIDAQEKALSRAQAERAKEMEARSKQIAQGLSKIRNEALGLVALFTAGMGLKNFAINTVNAGANVGWLADNLGMTTEKLSAYQQASQRAGGSVEGLNAQLKESADSVAKLGSGMEMSEGMKWFLRLGGNESDLKNGNTYLLARSKIIADMYKADPTKAALFASQMGISDDQFNFLKQGPELIQQQVAEREKLARFTRQDAAEAEKLRKQMLDLTQTLELTATKLLVQLAPSLIKVADALLQAIEIYNKWAGNDKKPADAKGVTTWGPFRIGKKKDLDAADGGSVPTGPHQSSSGKITSGSVAYNDPKLNDYATSVEKRLGLPAGILNSVKNAGERSNSDAVSPAGAKGVMQFMPDTWKKYGKGDITNPYASIDAAGLYFQDLLKRYNGNVDAAITEYNGGVKQARTVQGGGRPTAAETDAYLSRVKAELGKSNALASAHMPSGASVSVADSAAGSSTSTTEVRINEINVQTQATDAAGIARDIGPALVGLGYTTQANTGLS